MTITNDEELESAIVEWKALDSITPFTSPGSARMIELDEAIETYQDKKLIAELAVDPEWQELMKQLAEPVTTPQR